MIIGAMAKAEARVCAGADRCSVFPDRLQTARQTGTPAGWYRVGWIVSKGARESHDVWLEVRTGLVELIPRANARV